MTLSSLVLRSMAKNIKHYFLYFFALIFSVTLYFSFITLQYNPTVLLESTGMKPAAGFKTASVLIIFIVVFFVLYANHLFMKRRSKEIGLYQLIGMSKPLIIRLLGLENIILWALAAGIGVGLGFLSSRLFALILMRLLEQQVVVSLTFSTQALKQSLLLCAGLLLIVLVQSILKIRRVSLLSLFNASKQADERVKRFSGFGMVMGFIGLVAIGYGYYVSTQLFNLENATVNTLFIRMIVILAATIGGTFFVFRFSVSFVLNLVRMRKKGHLSITDVLALTPIMHRMKGNAKSLTLITVLTAVALTVLSLSYIAYYSSASSAQQSVPHDYMLMNGHGVEFMDMLEENNIAFKSVTFPIIRANVDIANLLSGSLAESGMLNTDAETDIISLSTYKQIHEDFTLQEGEGVIVNHGGLLAEMLPMKSNRPATVKTDVWQESIKIVSISDESVLSTDNMSAVVIVTDAMYDRIEASTDQSKTRWNEQIGINLLNKKEDLNRAEVLYVESGADAVPFNTNAEGKVYYKENMSQEQSRQFNIESMGVIIFVTAFLGLAFLLATGSILYFKQMSEAEDELESYTTLRKIGFSTSDLMKGIYVKQLFSFGVPLLIGLAHSFFAVKSGWLLFGTELATPLMITMGIYIALYSVFALLTIRYYKGIIRASL